MDDAVLRVHQFLPRSRANGPGVRAVLWVQETLRHGETAARERHWLAFTLAMLRWRRRFDIGLGEAPQRIAVGEFDIELEG